MKHTIKITAVILGLFLITQFIGLLVCSIYLPKQEIIINQQGAQELANITPELPYGMQPPEIQQERDFWAVIPSFAISIFIAVVLILLLSKYQWNFIIKLWFFSVVVLALGIAINAFMLLFNLFQENYIFSFPLAWILSLLIAIPLAIFKIYRPRVLIHNLTELFIYPGIAAVFIPILSPYTVLVLLILISIYDVWAVWHSGIMQKMAKYQMNELKIFGGLFIPYITKEMRAKIRKLKKLKDKKKLKKIKVNVAILGGGDIVFPIITAGVFLKYYGIAPALLIIFGAFAGLFFLLYRSEKKKFYPAMPFITGGIVIGLLIWLLSFAI